MYKQTNGVAMGSPLGPILANIFVGYYEHQLFQTVNAPLIYRRYVDDTFVLFSNRNESDAFLNHLGNLHPSLEFTCEQKIDNQIPFLDVLVERDNLTFYTSVFRKNTFTGEYIPWNSFCPLKRKTNLIACLTNRALKICSPSKLNEEISKIKDIFSNLGYPLDLVRRTILSARKPRPTGLSQKSVVYIRLPFIGPMSRIYQQRISTAVTKCYQSIRLRTIFNTRTLMKSHVKDVSPTLQQSNVVYKFSCRCGNLYVGRTSNRLQARINQHVPVNLRKRICDGPVSTNTRGQKAKRTYKGSSAIGQHLVENPECGRSFKDDQFTILSRARSEFHLSVLEAVYILSLKPPLCKQKNFVYTTLLFK